MKNRGGRGPFAKYGIFLALIFGAIANPAFAQVELDDDFVLDLFSSFNHDVSENYVSPDGEACDSTASRAVSTATDGSTSEDLAFTAPTSDEAQCDEKQLFNYQGTAYIQLISESAKREYAGNDRVRRFIDRFNRERFKASVNGVAEARSLDEIEAILSNSRSMATPVKLLELSIQRYQTNPMRLGIDYKVRYKEVTALKAAFALCCRIGFGK